MSLRVVLLVGTYKAWLPSANNVLTPTAVYAAVLASPRFTKPTVSPLNLSRAKVHNEFTHVAEYVTSYEFSTGLAVTPGSVGWEETPTVIVESYWDFKVA